MNFPRRIQDYDFCGQGGLGLWSIQDASFHSQIDLCIKDSVPDVGIRFSNFGNMVTILNEEILPKNKFDEILNLFESEDYCYIPEAVLGVHYDGKLENFEGSWFTRFFDFQ